ncbi:MAG: hypothetical protein IJT05_05210 [Lachnospiraceae bacterium]|nr:hypothetical protein [Lachnospiraceae bacterium]
MFISKLITGFSSEDYVKLVPENYMAQLRRGEMTAVAVFLERRGEDPELAGLAVTAVHASWLEIVYLYLPVEIRTPYRIADFLTYVIRQACRRNETDLIGAFVEIPYDELYMAYKTALRMIGMELSEVQGNVYQFPLSEITGKEALLKAGEKAELLPLQKADIHLLNRLERMMEEDSRPVAASPLMEWDEYNQELSLICFEKEEPTGLILISEAGEYLVLELTYTVSKTALPKLLGGVLARTDGLFPADKKVLVPIAVINSAEILIRMVPTGRRNSVLEGTLWFDEQKAPEELRALHSAV